MWDKRQRPAAELFRSALCVGLLTLGVVGAGAQPASAVPIDGAGVTADDPTPSCKGRGVTDLSVLNTGQTEYFTIRLNECDTLRLRNWLAAGAAGGSTCSAITKWVKIAAPPYKPHAEVADAICSTLGASSGASALILNQRNDAGGKCGVVLELVSTATPDIANPMSDRYTTVPRSLTIKGQKCQAGVAPKGTDKPKYTAKPVAKPGPISNLAKVPLDVAFVIDDTQSMAASLGQVKAAANDIVRNTNWAWAKRRVMVVTYNDPGAKVRSAFTSDPAATGAALNGITAAGGGDVPEDVLSGVMTAVKASWTPAALKTVVVIGDAAGHDHEKGTGYTTASTVAAANAVPSEGVTVNGLVVGSDAGAKKTFTDLATGTGGGVFPAADKDAVVLQMLKALTTVGTDKG